MRHIIVIFMICFVRISVTAQRITVNFYKTSMSEALLTVERQNNKCRINFIYEDLQDFSVTQKIKNRSVAEALRLIAGFYPIRITQNGNDFFVECIQKEMYKVTGRILDEKSQPLSMASVELLNPQDSSLIGNGVSNNNGDVVIPCGRKNVIAKVSYVGYKTAYKNCPDGLIGTMKLDGNVIALKGVTIKGQNPIVMSENGIQTYDMKLLLREMPGGNAYEALTRIPGLMSKISGLSFAGIHATLIINGKSTTLSEKQIVERLKNMPAEMLARAEVMMSAPASYHTQGVSINVITKDYVGTKQLSGQIQGTAQQGKYGLVQGNGNLLYSHNRIVLDAQYVYTGGKSYSEAGQEAEHPYISGRKYYEDFVQNTSDIAKHELRIGVDYAFADKHRLGIAYMGTWQEVNAVNLTTGTVPVIQQGDVHNLIQNIDMNYQLPFGLKMNASYMSYRNPREQILGENMRDLVYTLSTNSNQSIDKWILTANQEHRIKNDCGIIYGIKTQVTNNISYQKTYDGMGMEIPKGASRVNYQERIVSPYVGVSKVFNKHLSLDISVSAEHYHTPRWNECRIYPSLRATWNMNKDNYLNLSFSSNAVYPSYWSTMNSVYFASAYKEIWGNPELKSYSHNEINLMWQHKQKYSLSFFARMSPDYSAQLPFQPCDTMTVVLQEKNFDFSNMYGLQASVLFGAGNWLMGNVSLVGYYRRDKSSDFFDLPFDRECFTAMLSSNISARLLSHHDLRLILIPSFQTKSIQGVCDIDPVFMLRMQLYWLSDNRRWSLTIAGNNLTNCFYNTKSVCGSQNIRMKENNDYRTVSFTAALKFGGYKANKHKEIDISRMGY